MKGGFCYYIRSRVIQFLIRSAGVLKVSPMVKYSALSLFAGRFYPAISRCFTPAMEYLEQQVERYRREFRERQQRCDERLELLRKQQQEIYEQVHEFFSNLLN
ncbi:hypothetical protein OROGR_030802 [Orobanche gracilis]